MLQVGRRELYAFVQRYTGDHIHSFSDLINGDALCKLFTITFPKKVLKPLNPTVHSASTRSSRNWAMFHKAAESIGVPAAKIFQGPPNPAGPYEHQCVQALVLLFFAFHLAKNSELTAAFTVDMCDELSEYMQSPSILDCLVRGGAMRLEQIPQELLHHIENNRKSENTQMKISAGNTEFLDPTEPSFDEPDYQKTGKEDNENILDMFPQLIQELEELHEELDRQVAEKKKFQEENTQCTRHFENVSAALSVSNERRQSLEQELFAAKAEISLQKSTIESLKTTISELKENHRPNRCSDEEPRSPSLPQTVVGSGEGSPPIENRWTVEKGFVDTGLEVKRLADNLVIKINLLGDIVDCALGDSATDAGHQEVISACLDELSQMLCLSLRNSAQRGKSLTPMPVDRALAFGRGQSLSPEVSPELVAQLQALRAALAQEQFKRSQTEGTLQAATTAFHSKIQAIEECLSKEQEGRKTMCSQLLNDVNEIRRHFEKANGTIASLVKSFEQVQSIVGVIQALFPRMQHTFNEENEARLHEQLSRIAYIASEARTVNRTVVDAMNEARGEILTKTLHEREHLRSQTVQLESQVRNMEAQIKALNGAAEVEAALRRELEETFDRMWFEKNS